MTHHLIALGLILGIALLVSIKLGLEIAELRKLIKDHKRKTCNPSPSKKTKGKKK